MSHFPLMEDGQRRQLGITVYAYGKAVQGNLLLLSVVTSVLCIDWRGARMGEC